MSTTIIRINGRGNAWPVLLGSSHPMYSLNIAEDYANASFSILKYEGLKPEKKNIEWEILIDAGHGLIPFLLKNNNRIPDAIVLTHSHFDHILGIDWIIQSYSKSYDKKPYPVYATKSCWNAVLKTLPHLNEMVDLVELYPGSKFPIKEATDLSVQIFPVYHSKRTPGSSMLLFTVKEEKVVFSGDLLVPLLSSEDYETLSSARYCFVDSNNRFPYPGTNHWSLIGQENCETGMDHFTSMKDSLTIDNLIEPHLEYENKLLDIFKNDTSEMSWRDLLAFNVFDFINKIKPELTIPVHYSGAEDKKYHDQEILDDCQLQKWLNSQEYKYDLPTKFQLLAPGETLLL